ncbi:uncharacterized protein LOC127850138 isoform X2 [Dreissena polymorpha]|uniref:uncharacterized protein LOC127850138 isoform X2 n=1 Tax=Dreissena polymorpha TaxID=45954 RepID=UPI002264A394|nr:uncharacterized protein LOC127850138 isoform X2 [Dreissena polymorpha]
MRMPKLKKRSYQQKNAARREMIRQKRISEKGGGDGVLKNSGKPIFEGLKSPSDSQGSASSNERSQRMTRTPKIPLLSASKKYKRKKPVTECNTMKKDTESDSRLIKGFYSTTQSVRVCVETLNSDRALDNSVCVKIETDEWYNTAAGFNSACVKLEQVQGDEIHSDHKKQDSFNLVHEQTGCLQMDQCKVMHVQTAPFSHSGSVSLLQNMMTENSAEQHFPIASNSSLHANALVCTSNVETMPNYQLSPSDASTEADDRLFLQSWYGLPSENHNDHSIDGSVSDVKPVLSTLDKNTLHGNGQHGCICNPGSGIVPSVVSPSWPTVDSQPTDPTQVVNIPLPSSSTQSTQPQYFQHQQPQLVTTVKIPHCGGMAEPVFDEKQDTGDQTLEENKLLVLNELQLSLFGSKEDLLAFENGNLLPSVQHFFSDLTPAINFASKTDANLLCTLPVQDLPTSVSIPSVVGSSVTADSRKSTDAVGERASKSVKKDVPINQSIGLSSDVTESMDQKVAILPLNALHVPMPLLSCDSKSNQLQGTSDSQRDGMSLSVSSKRTEFAVTSEINSNLAAESAESSDDDCVEIFIGRNKRKRNSHQSTHPSPKRVRDQGSSRGVVQPTGASTRVNAAIESDQVKKIVKKKSQEYQKAEVRRFGGKTYGKSPNEDSAASKVFDEVFAKPKQAKWGNVSYVKQRADCKNSEKEQLQEEDKDPFKPAIRMTLTKSPGKPSSVKSELNDNAVDEFTVKKVNVQAYCKSSGRKIRTESPDVSFVKVDKILKQEKTPL